jgi:hypothetical protein
MEPEDSLTSLQELSTCTYPEPDQSSPQHLILSLKGPNKKNKFKKVVPGLLE